jgi:protease IV
MNDKPESIFRSSIRAFSSAFFKGVGYLVIMIPVMMLIGGIAALKDKTPQSSFEETVLPDAGGKRPNLSAEKPKILQIDIHGLIGSDKLNTQTIEEMLLESREDKFAKGPVEAVFLHINTPGGTVFDSDGIYRALKSYKEKYNVPIYAYVDGLCASGGMYIASAADKVYTSDVSLVGSVGVLLSTFINFNDALEKIGIQTMTISAGKGKDALNPLRHWNENESENLKLLVDNFYSQFVNLVAENRPNISKEKLINDYGAKVFPAEMAKEYGYIDETGSSRETVLTALKEQAGIADDYQVVRLSKDNWFENLFRVESPLFTGKIQHQINLGFELPPEFNNKFLYLYQPGL